MCLKDVKQLLLLYILYKSKQASPKNAVLCTFMQSTARQGLKLRKVVHQVAVLVLGMRGHVVEFPDVTLPDSQSENLHATFP